METLLAILRHDPYNRSRRHHIKKLTGGEVGEGQWRIRWKEYRLRYDILGRDVVLYSFRHRKEAY
jgi:mRNA-degrading endonuclease RelE of RelBE toxin-antitoxin system